MQTLLIANRGEIAVRVIRCARELGIRTVAVCSQTDQQALHVRLADRHVVIGEAPAAQSYLNVDAILEAARQEGADAIHPGYGFLSERADFARRVEETGIAFVGPTADSIRLMGDKALARASASKAGVPTLPGSDGALQSAGQALRIADSIGYPVVLKAAAGGGGRGIRVVGSAEELRDAMPQAQAEASASFGVDEVYLERFISAARHVEVQVFGDGKHFIHLGERDCSLQRRRQKVVEEAGAPNLPLHIRQAMTAAAVRLAAAVHYRGAGTVEFLYDAERPDFWFIEMNTRIQVEHPVTEMTMGVDLVREQLTVAAGQPLSIVQDQVESRGHAIEMRINAEDVGRGFLPSPGRLEQVRWPGGPFVRIDTSCDQGDDVSPYYDSLIAKVIAWGDSRSTAIARAKRALSELEIRGVKTTVRFLREVIDLPEFAAATHHTTFLESWLAERQDSHRESA